MSTNETNDPRYRAAELGAILARRYPDAPHHLVARVVFDMQRAAKRAVSWEVRRCNEGMTEAQEEAGRRRFDQAAGRINAALAHPRLINDESGNPGVIPSERAFVTLGGDPRGPCARLHIPGERGDGWGEGFAIY